MVVPTDTTDLLPPGVTCGATCIDIVDANAVPFQIRFGDVALLQVQSERRLIFVPDVTNGGAGVRHHTFSNANTLFAHPAGLTSGLRLTRCGGAAIVGEHMVSQHGQQHATAFRWLQPEWITAGVDHSAWRRRVHDAPAIHQWQRARAGEWA